MQYALALQILAVALRAQAATIKYDDDSAVATTTDEVSDKKFNLFGLFKHHKPKKTNTDNVLKKEDTKNTITPTATVPKATATPAKETAAATTTPVSGLKKYGKKALTGISYLGNGLMVYQMLGGGSSSSDETSSDGTDGTDGTDDTYDTAATYTTDAPVTTSLGDCFIAGITGYSVGDVASASSACLATEGTITTDADAILATMMAA